jgi:hypothetical protein
MSDEVLEKFVKWQSELLDMEREEDVSTREKLLASLTNNQLQQRGLALLGVSVASSRTGLGGKTQVYQLK